MKKILFTCLIALVAISANAQISKNSVLLGGDVGFGTGKTTDNNNYEQKNNGGSISLSLGKAIKENTVVGFNIGYNGQTRTNVASYLDTSKQTLNGYTVGVFYRQYKSIAKDFYFFGQANAFYSYSVQKNEFKNNTSNNTDVKQSSAVVSITPGFAYKLFKKTFIELSLANLASLQYTHANNKQGTNNETKTNSISLSTAFSNNNSLGNVGLGFRFIL